jgi:threonyl-tRNA synthetase
MKDTLGREWQTGTIQLDFQQPRRFNLEYTDTDGSRKTPIAIHRVIYGSLERFIGIIIEHFAGAFPTWLAPVQIVVLPISDRHVEYANKVVEELKEEGIRVELDGRAETLGSKIRDGQTQKIPYMIILGDKEVEANLIAVRSREKGDLGQMELKSFIKDAKMEIKEKRLN